jgi:uncharacterized membrane protein
LLTKQKTKQRQQQQQQQQQKKKKKKKTATYFAAFEICIVDQMARIDLFEHRFVFVVVDIVDVVGVLMLTVDDLFLIILFCVCGLLIVIIIAIIIVLIISTKWRWPVLRDCYNKRNKETNSSETCTLTDRSQTARANTNE